MHEIQKLCNKENINYNKNFKLEFTIAFLKNIFFFTVQIISTVISVLLINSE